MAAIAQAKPALHTEAKTGEGRLRRAKVLYLIDVNKPVDDVADRMFRLCRDAGLEGKVVRMYGWPYELRHSETLDASSTKKEESSRLDFTFQFVNVAKAERSSISPDKAPTLDQVAWAHFQLHREDEYASLAESLDKLLKEGGAIRPKEVQSLRRLVYRLYKDVLKDVSFIATTPVSSSSESFSEMYRPDILFVDEAPHARELTSLVS